MANPGGTERTLEQRRPIFVVRVMRELWRLAVDRPYRYTTWLRLTGRKGAFQPFNDTRENRYPKMFGFVQSKLGADSALKILSFGCSTGEEVFSLRSYFSRAAIKGVDINPGNIAICRRRLKQIRDAAISFELTDSMRAEPSGAYDAIFCMAVLRHGSLGLPGVTRCDPLLQFEDFARMVADFARCLKPGGLLIIRHSNFRLCDTPVAGDFETIMSVPLAAAAQKTPLFGADNQLLRGVEYPDTVFRKQ
jgi:SAM-dependent methyltransferase